MIFKCVWAFSAASSLLCCSCLGSPPVFQSLVRLRRLGFGGPALEELKRGDLSGVTQLEELTVHANNLSRFGTDCVCVLLHESQNTSKGKETHFFKITEAFMSQIKKFWLWQLQMVLSNQVSLCSHFKSLGRILQLWWPPLKEGGLQQSYKTWYRCKTRNQTKREKAKT